MLWLCRCRLQGHGDAAFELVCKMQSSLEDGHSSIVDVHGPERSWWQGQCCTEKGPHHRLVSDYEMVGAWGF